MNLLPENTWELNEVAKNADILSEISSEFDIEANPCTTSNLQFYDDFDSHLWMANYLLCQVDRQQFQLIDPSGCIDEASASIDAINWMQDAISTKHHHAVDIVDYCYLMAISGKPIEKFLSPLRELNNEGTIDWTALGQLAYQVAAGSETLGEAMLLGLGDANIWSRIGTLYLDFANDPSEAIMFYDQAVKIDPRSPMYHYNKARALAYGKRDYVSAQQCLAQSRRLAMNMWGWFKVNQNQFIQLEQFIAENIAMTSLPK